MQSRDELELTNVSGLNSGDGEYQHDFIRSPRSQRKPERKFFLHLKLLLHKNYLIQIRSIRALLLQCFTPLLVCLLLQEWQYLATSVTSGVQIDSPIHPIGNIPKCFFTPEDPDNCLTIAYGIIGPSEPWIHSVMDYVTRTNGFQMDKDVKYVGTTTPQDFTNSLMNKLNYTQLGVIFCTGAWDILGMANIPCQFETKTDKKLIMYSLVYNVTEYIKPPAGDDFRVAHPKHPFAANLKMSLDNAIISYFSIDKEAKGDKTIDLVALSENAPKMRADYQDFPKTHFRFMIGSDVVTMLGCLQFAIPFMLNFLITSFEIVREKSKRLREGLTVMGMSPTAYWISWTITCFAMNTIITTSILITGHLFQYKFFTDTPTIVLFALFFFLGLGFQSIAFFISTISASATTAYVISYAVLLASIILTLFINNMGMCMLLFSENPPTWYKVLRVIYHLIPSFSYATTFVHISSKSGNHYDMFNNYWVAGTGFKYSDLFEPEVGYIPGYISWTIPPAWRMLMMILLDALLYLVLTWYCDNVISHNRGTSASPLFFLQRQYWSRLAHETRDRRKKPQAPKPHLGSHTEYNYTNLNIENSVEVEQERVTQNHQTGAQCKGLRIVGIDKVYSRSIFGFSGKDDVHAVRDVYLEVEDGELLGLLGHNGAGKTTLIGVLTGLLKPSSGTAEMYNYDIGEDMDSIRQIMGVCPQFDILWEELTAAEHLKMFAKLKGIPDDAITEEIEKRLRDVNLLPVKDARAGTFSGGMKRRLSMAIAFIGDPRIVFLDEPTTGMDPKNRRYIWELVQKMKKGRAVILTTHAMEEADILSDRIAVISKGSLQCVGTGLYLKNKYGDGYRLSLVVEKEDVEATKVELLNIIPSSKVLDCSGGSLLVGIPLVHVEELKTFFRIMENKSTNADDLKFKAKIKDWGLSHTTLEEVFMKITSAHRG